MTTLPVLADANGLLTGGMMAHYGRTTVLRWTMMHRYSVQERELQMIRGTSRLMPECRKLVKKNLVVYLIQFEVNIFILI